MHLLKQFNLPLKKFVIPLLSIRIQYQSGHDISDAEETFWENWDAYKYPSYEIYLISDDYNEYLIPEESYLTETEKSKTFGFDDQDNDTQYESVNSSIEADEEVVSSSPTITDPTTEPTTTSTNPLSISSNVDEILKKMTEEFISIAVC